MAIIAEALLGAIPNDYKLKKDYLENKASNLETLILGSSHAYYGLDARYFSSRAFNAGYVSQTLDLDQMLLEKHVDQLTQLKFVVLPISYFSFFNQLRSGEESWRSVNYLKYYKLKFDHPWRSNAEILSLRMNVVVHKLYNYYLRRNSGLTSNEFGSGTESNTGSLSGFEESGRVSALRHTAGDIHTASNQQMLYENEHSLRSLLRICEERNLKVILFMPPADPAYRMHLDELQLRTTIAKAHKISADYPNCIFVDLLADPYFDKEDFSDADHMSGIGAKKLSLLINDILMD